MVLCIFTSISMCIQQIKKKISSIKKNYNKTNTHLCEGLHWAPNNRYHCHRFNSKLVILRTQMLVLFCFWKFFLFPHVINDAIHLSRYGCFCFVDCPCLLLWFDLLNSVKLFCFAFVLLFEFAHFVHFISKARKAERFQ